ncbi:hypothetical protein L218DRAFT_1001781 [Marasmius fiardii PR-910]|nr:hypothetical protein L218DRAFT_1001781 [Marasmius fiardii PR-910]
MSEMDENAVTPEGGNNRLRYPSEDPEMLQKRIWTYDPTPQSEDEMLKVVFKGFEELITMYLYCKPLKGNNGIQKTLLQLLPKPGNYGGEDNLTYFDTFVQDLNAYVLTSVDMQRTNALAVFLKSSACHYYVDVVERIPDDFDSNDPLKGCWTFMQVVAGLYHRFIHEASLTRVVDQYKAVTYAKSHGVEGLFSTLKKHTKKLPTPPDLYNFK